MIKKLSGRVLLVEDNIVNQKLAVAILKKTGLDYELANNGEEAISLWQRNNYDLILMDCQMPIMDGYKATEKIRRLETNAHTPIIAITGNATENDSLHCKESGMDDFLSKPFDINDLISVLEKWLSQPEHSTQNAGETPGLDYAVIDELKKSLEQDFHELVEIYITSTRNILYDMEQACNAADHQEIQRLAHSIKSSSANLGAIKLSLLAEDLENQLIKNNFSNIKNKIDEMQKLFTLSAPTLKSF